MGTHRLLALPFLFPSTCTSLPLLFLRGTDHKDQDSTRLGLFSLFLWVRGGGRRVHLMAHVFATDLGVAFLAALARHATTTEAIQHIAISIFNITVEPLQSTKDIFAAPAMVAAFAHMATHATTAECVEWLAIAIYNITNGKTQSTKDAFATPDVVAAIARMATNATTAKSVRWLAGALCSVTCGEQQATKDAFAAPAIVNAVIVLASYATTATSVEWIATAVYNITDGTTQATKDAFCQSSGCRGICWHGSLHNNSDVCGVVHACRLENQQRDNAIDECSIRHSCDCQSHCPEWPPVLQQQLLWSVSHARCATLQLKRHQLQRRRLPLKSSVLLLRWPPTHQQKIQLDG